ncbi:MAG: TonB-dependent receptor plug domain-containing protein [Brevinematia bacterium]
MSISKVTIVTITLLLLLLTTKTFSDNQMENFYLIKSTFNIPNDISVSEKKFSEYDIESYVVDNRVSKEEYTSVERISNTSSKSLGGSIISPLEEAGIYLQNRGIFDVQTDLSIRGTRFSQTGVAVNGVLLNDIQSGHLNFTLPITIYDIGLIEIQKSANSTIYGSDVVGGVVNFNLPIDVEENIKFKTYSGGNGLFGSTFSVSKGFGLFGLKISYDRKLSDGYRFNTDFNNWTLNTTIVSKLYGVNTSIFIGHVEKDFGASYFYGTESREREFSTLGMLNLSYGSTKVNVAYRRSIDNYTVNITNPNTQINNHQKENFTVSVENTFKLNNYGNLFTKIESKYNVISSKAEISNQITNLLGDRFDAPVSLVIEYGLWPIEGLSLSLGGRGEFWYLGDRKYEPIICPSLKGYYYILPSVKISGSVNRFFRVPTYVELYYYDGIAFGNTNLKPEEGWNYELNLNYFLNNTKTSYVYVSGYWRDAINVIDFSDDKTIPGLKFEAQNIRWISGGGVDLGINLNTKEMLGSEGNIKLFYGYSKFNSGAPANYTFRYDKYLEHQLNLSLEQSIDKLYLYIITSLRNRFEGFDINGNLLPYTTYTLINAKVSYEVVSGGRLFVEGYNLGDVSYQDINKVDMPRRWIWAGIEFNLM